MKFTADMQKGARVSSPFLHINYTQSLLNLHRMTTAAVSRCGLALFFCQLMTLPTHTVPGLFVVIQYLIFHIHIVTRITFLGCHFPSVNMVALHAHIHFLVPLVRKFSNLPGGCRLHCYYRRTEIRFMTFGKSVYNSCGKKPSGQAAEQYSFHLLPLSRNWLEKPNSFFLLLLSSRKSTGKFFSGMPS
jgi:hypothetical protein